MPPRKTPVCAPLSSSMPLHITHGRLRGPQCAPSRPKGPASRAARRSVRHRQARGPPLADPPSPPALRGSRACERAWSEAYTLTHCRTQVSDAILEAHLCSLRSPSCDARAVAQGTQAAVCARAHVRSSAVLGPRPLENYVREHRHGAFLWRPGSRARSSYMAKRRALAASTSTRACLPIIPAGNRACDTSHQTSIRLGQCL